MVAAGRDRTISPKLERGYAARAGSQVMEVPGAGHIVHISHPKEVAAVIDEAAKNTGK